MMAAFAIQASSSRRFGETVKRIEDFAITGTFCLMILLPLCEIPLRKLWHTGISGNAAIVQHLVLVLGMLGAAIAARNNDLLPLSTLDELLPAAWKSIAKVFAGAVSIAVALLLTLAAWQFIVTERETGKALVYQLPLWVVELAFPVCFGVIAVRLARHASGALPLRALTLALGAIIAGIAYSAHVPHLYTTFLLMLVIAALLGAPAFVLLGGTALFLFLKAGEPIASIPIAHYSLVTNPTLPTLPLFTIAGYLLAEGRAPVRMVRLFEAAFGSIRGGPALVTVLVCAFFTSFTGASGVTILALGGILMPLLKEASFSDRDALGLVTGTGSIGMLLPPCLPLILYAVIARIPMEQMFLGGIMPGLLMVTAVAIWGVWRAKSAAQQPPFSFTRLRQCTWEAKWELMLPVVAFVALMSGWATAVEAAAATALFAFTTQVFIHRDLDLLRGVPRVMAECGALIGGVLLILGVALGFTNYLVDAEVTDKLLTWVTHSIHSRWVFLMALNLFMWVAGCLMDIYSAIVIQIPLLLPLGAAFGIDPVHLGIIFLANLELGYLTPPVGLNLILASTRFRRPIPEVLRAVVPMICVFTAVVLLISFLPWLTTALPHRFSHFVP